MLNHPGQTPPSGNLAVNAQGLHQYHIAAAYTLLSQAAARGFRRRHSTHWRLGDVLRTGGAQAVRGDGRLSVDESVAIGRSRDKLRCLQLLARRGIGLPVTAFTHDPREAEDIIDLVGGAPVVIKFLEGTQGIGVVLGETVKSAKSVIEAFQGVNVNILVQQFIKEADATDIRALVIGEKLVAAMTRSGPPGEFRSNLHRGGSGEMVRITPQERSAAVRAARTLGLNVCGIDMLRSKSGPLVLEVNSSPGIEGLEKATGIDVAGLMIDFLERNAAPGNTRTKGKG
jgi:ribosomal protein S6--L-glutamate ligase